MYTSKYRGGRKRIPTGNKDFILINKKFEIFCFSASQLFPAVSRRNLGSLGWKFEHVSFDGAKCHKVHLFSGQIFVIKISI